MKTNLLICSTLVCLCAPLAAAASPSFAAAPTFAIAPGDIIFTEFFDGWHKLDPDTGAVTELPWADSSIFTSTIRFDTDGAILVDDIVAGESAIRRLNPFHGRGNSLGVPGISLTDGFVVEPSGDLLIANSGDVAHFDRVTRQTTTVTEDTFFSPNGIARGADGRVFITEFFEQLWEVNVAGSGRSLVPLTEDLSIPGLIAVRSDGKLIVKNFSPNTLNIIDPDTGSNEVFSADVPTFVSDFALDANDNLWLTATDGVFKFDSSGGAKTLVFDESFFNPGAIAVVPDGWVVVGLPEPAAAGLLLCWVVFPLLSRSHRRQRRAATLQSTETASWPYAMNQPSKRIAAGIARSAGRSAADVVPTPLAAAMAALLCTAAIHSTAFGRSLPPDSQGDLLVATWANGWKLIDSETGDITDLDWSAPSFPIAHIQFAPDGAVLTSTTFDGFLRINPLTGRSASLDLPRFSSAVDFLALDSGEILVSTIRSLGLYAPSGELLRSIGRSDIEGTDPRILSIEALSLGNDGQVFIYEVRDGIGAVDLSTNTGQMLTTSVTFQGGISNLSAMPDGRLALFTGGGTGRPLLRFFDPDTLSISDFTGSLPTDAVSMTVDLSGGVWLRQRTGLSKVAASGGPSVLVTDAFRISAMAVVPDDWTFAGIPEPSSFVLLLIGSVAVSPVRRCRL